MRMLDFQMMAAFLRNIVVIVLDVLARQAFSIDVINMMYRLKAAQ